MRNSPQCFLLALAGLFVFAAVADSQAAAQTNDPCTACHADLTTVVPKAHPAVATAGATLATCLTCHSAGQAGRAERNGFSARVHLRHVGGKAAPDCKACHTIVPGERFGLIGQSVSWGAPRADDLAALEEIAVSWATSGFTDHLHAKASVGCAGCHGKAVPRLDDTVENERCLACHGPIETLADKTRDADFPKRNPHASHLGSDVACTVCHHAHQKAVVYCAGCHQRWTMKIPGAAPQ